MVVAIHKDRYGRFDPYCNIYEEILAHNHIKSIRVDVNDGDFWETIKSCDAFIYRWIQWDDHHLVAKDIMPIIENVLGIKCFPDQKTSWFYDDKVKEYYLLRQHNYPVINSWIFYDRKKALEWLKGVTEFPLVFKLKGGAASTNVMLVKNRRKAASVINKMFGSGVVHFFWGTARVKDFNLFSFIKHLGGNMLRKLKHEDPELFWYKNKNYVLFQQFLPGNSFDTKIIVIGGRAFGHIRRVRKNDFRASGSGLRDMDHNLVDIRCVEIALKISEELNFQSMTFDFLFGIDGEPLIAEISYATVGVLVYQCEGYWDKQLKFHEGHYWMQYFQLVDLLNDPALKQPEIIGQGFSD